MRNIAVAGVSLLLLSVFCGNSHATSDSLCGTTAVDILSSQLQAASMAADSVVEARVVFITFPNALHDSLPAWGEAFLTEINDYIQVMSRGRQRFNISILKRPALSGRAWMTSQDDTSYHFDYGAINREIMTQITDSLGPPPGAPPGATIWWGRGAGVHHPLSQSNNNLPIRGNCIAWLWHVRAWLQRGRNDTGDV